MKFYSTECYNKNWDRDRGIYKTRWFARWAHQEGLRDEWLHRVVREMSEGLFEANLGGHLIKKRVARPGQGKRGGLRTIVATQLKEQWFFVYGFAKNERDNISRDEEAALDAGEVIEVKRDA